VNTQPEHPASSVRHEEELAVSTRAIDAGRVRIHKSVDTERVSEHVDTLTEGLDGVEHAAAEPGDSGEIETLPDGSISIPILEEQLVITKRLVVRERVIVRKTVTTHHRVVEADLRRERISVEGDIEPDDNNTQRSADADP
jgi:uncharacterized protein (TIGR02271 family)